ncbi:MAG TPA: hypothetical protein PK024_10515 [Methanospirillum sp.]|uniref:tryptophan transporter n=1 Tax=Methanospirillum sp. TaxID=45200 RepID=UPI002BCE6806|nr:tryptophan transporter [Methanospirillum sp.]HOJ97253.1 hypothetical protein [Methanospirillum sp.]HOL40550.1 hypothetical protein [Methanospirillum sp.]HPP78313.1 hypothetical protein [Methanospirillum sp.]
MKSQDIAIVGILLAVGAIARFAALYAPLPPFLVPNFVIVFYCLAIMLVVPKFSQALGIGFIGGIISALISHSIFPPGNLISEPIGAVVCLLVFQALKRTAAAPSIATLLATFASGISFLCVVMLLVMVAPGLLFKAFNYESLYAFFSAMMVMIVIPTAIINTIIAQILYIPASRALSRRS